jgi:drug/metabolite transporter (DMT)-like permease
MTWDFGSSFWLVLVAALWGSTNPLMKQGASGIDSIPKHNRFLQPLYELIFLLLNWRYMLPFTLNQCGSVLYYVTLASVDLSLAVPVANSLTFIFTAFASRLMGEHIPGRTFAGMLFVVAGVTLCVFSKS